MAQVSKASVFKNVYLKILCTSFLSSLKVKRDGFFILSKNYLVRFFIFVFISFAILFFSVPEVAAQVVINEFSVDPPDKQDWIELYSVETVDVSGWKIGDEAGIFYTFPAGAKLNTGAYYVVTKYKRLNNDKDSIYLYDANDSLKDFIRYGYEGEVCLPSSSGSIARVPDGADFYDRLLISTKGITNGTVVTDPCPSPTPISTQTPTPTPVSTSSSNSSSSKATVKINSAKDQNGSELLGSFKIYIDGNYTGNYAPETYTFCSDCKCGSNNVPCGFGNHTFKVEKTGYNSWTKTAEISADNNYEFDPVLTLVSSSPSPTLKATPTATASATPKSTTFNISTSSESALLAEDVFSNKGVLGASSESKTPTPVSSQSDSKFKLAALFFIISGLSFLGSAVYAYLRKKKNAKPDESKSEEAS